MLYPVLLVFSLVVLWLGGDRGRLGLVPGNLQHAAFKLGAQVSCLEDKNSRISLVLDPCHSNLVKSQVKCRTFSASFRVLNVITTVLASWSRQSSISPNFYIHKRESRQREFSFSHFVLIKIAKFLTRKCGISSSFSSCATPKMARALGLWSTTMRFTVPPRPLISRLRPRPRPACIDPGSIFPRPRPRPVGGLISPNCVA